MHSPTHPIIKFPPTPITNTPPQHHPPHPLSIPLPTTFLTTPQTCWRAYLWQKLQTAGITNIDFVGSHATPSGNCTLSGTPVPFDKDNEGHSGARVTDYASKNQLPPWLSAAKPDIILMHVGTNDAVANIASADVIAAYDVLLGQMRASNPRNVLLVSKLIPIDPRLFGQGVSDRIVEYNGAMEGWVERVSTGRSPVVLVDMFTGFDVGSMTREGEHPNEKGDVFFAEKFFPVLKDLLVRVPVEDMMRGRGEEAVVL